MKKNAVLMLVWHQAGYSGIEGEDEMTDYLMILLIFCAMLAEVLIVIFVSADVIIEILEGD